MNKRSMRILGFYQVQNMLVRLAPSRLSKEIARRLRPVNDSEVIERNLTDTEEAVRCMQTETMLLGKEDQTVTRGHFFHGIL